MSGMPDMAFAPALAAYYTAAAADVVQDPPDGAPMAPRPKMDPASRPGWMLNLDNR